MHVCLYERLCGGLVVLRRHKEIVVIIIVILIFFYYYQEIAFATSGWLCIDLHTDERIALHDTCNYVGCGKWLVTCWWGAVTWKRSACHRLKKTKRFRWYVSTSVANRLLVVLTRVRIICQIYCAVHYSFIYKEAAR